jgi:hypothetical protein
MAGEHLTGYSTVYFIFLLILNLIKSLSAIIENKFTKKPDLSFFLVIYFEKGLFYTGKSFSGNKKK